MSWDIVEVFHNRRFIMATSREKTSEERGRTGGGTSKRGFASMDAERQRQIASQGGKAAHEKGTAHEFDSAEAREAGRKGGKAAHEKGTAHEFDSEEAREAGRKGGKASGGSRRKNAANRAAAAEKAAAPPHP